MKTLSSTMYHNPANNLSLAGSGHAVIETTHNSISTVRIRNIRLLLTHVQKHFKLVSVSRSALGRDYTYILKNKGNINSSCKEFLLEDFQKRSLRLNGHILGRRWPAHTIQELTDNEAIMYESSKGGLSGDLKPRNSFVHHIRRVQIVMIRHNMEILQRILQRIRYIEQTVLAKKIRIIIEYHRELSVASQETLSMRNRTLGTEVRRQAKCPLNLKGELRKIHTVLQQLKRTILVSLAILKIKNLQEALRGIRTIILKQYHAVINSAYNFLRRSKHHPHIRSSEYLYVLLRVSEYGQKFDVTDYYWMLCSNDSGAPPWLKEDRDSQNPFLTEGDGGALRNKTGELFLNKELQIPCIRKILKNDNSFIEDPTYTIKVYFYLINSILLRPRNNSVRKI
ncbi:hypothetical protein C922_05332 [Plasmodium inui San Antonio 1]|uniref:Uncharacterized protein n=1 Tax=Plasmodium inui San Antonio 1 TaxID=1237626 RepID=W6ZTQ2_9APIC|nr:hypothetical protein C922_05332 [Plasmodium inui San Antonio 1]EUD64287.1 hypothetical protein C922_05332 [Plasmodium inui San Antonio 1]